MPGNRSHFLDRSRFILIQHVWSCGIIKGVKGGGGGLQVFKLALLVAQGKAATVKSEEIRLD